MAGQVDLRTRSGDIVPGGNVIKVSYERICPVRAITNLKKTKTRTIQHLGIVTGGRKVIRHGILVLGLGCPRIREDLVLVQLRLGLRLGLGLGLFLRPL